MILPGCKVTVEKLTRDSFKVVHFDADLNYFNLQKKGDAPGLYTATTNHRWNAEPVKSGSIKRQEGRLVAIADARYMETDVAANTIAPRLENTPFSGGKHTVEREGFDFHFTPGGKRIGGMKSYKDAINPNDNKSLHASALLLARSMYEARDIKGVAWISEFGGSGILTQALTILAAQKVKLDKHHAFLYRPATSPNKAIQAAHAVGLNLDRKFTKTHILDVIGNRDQLALISNRLKYETGYTRLKAATDVVAHGKSLQGAAFAIAGIAGSVGVSMAAPAAAAPFITALGLAAAKVGGVLTTAKLAATAVEAHAPATYDKIKDRF